MSVTVRGKPSKGTMLEAGPMDSAVRIGREFVVPGHGHATAAETAPLKPSGIIKFQAPEIVFGPESLAEAGFAARRIGAQRPFVVADPGIIAAGWADELSQHLADADLPATFWSGLTPNPKDFEIAEGYQRYREMGCDVIIAIGGGSCLDAAKGIAILNAVRLVFDNLPRIVDRDATGDLRDHMAQASLEAGMDGPRPHRGAARRGAGPLAVLACRRAGGLGRPGVARGAAGYRSHGRVGLMERPGRPGG